MKNNKKNVGMEKIIRTTLVVIFCILLIVGYYYYLSHRNQNGALGETEELTEAQEIIALNLDERYPSSPREVVKLFNRILKCYYNDEHETQEEIKDLAFQQRKLLDEELVANNPEAEYLQGIRNDIKEYKAEKRTISSSSVCGTNEVIYKTIDGRECAYVTSSYFLKEGNGHKTTYQRYVLRRDEAGLWKILVYYIVKGE